MAVYSHYHHSPPALHTGARCALTWPGVTWPGPRARPLPDLNSAPPQSQPEPPEPAGPEPETGATTTAFGRREPGPGEPGRARAASRLGETITMQISHPASPGHKL